MNLKDPTCCPPSNVVAVADLCENKKVLKEFIRCVPIQQPCDGTTETVFQSLAATNPDAVVIVTNTSDCTMTVAVNGTTFTIDNNDSAVAVVSGLSTITFTCAPPGAAKNCTGTLELDLTSSFRL
jgi:hypothetical protein